MGEFGVSQPSTAALRLDILKLAGGRVNSLLAIPAEARLCRQGGEACVSALGNCNFRWVGFSGYGIRRVNDAQKQNPARTPQAPRGILADGNHAVNCDPLGCLLPVYH